VAIELTAIVPKHERRIRCVFSGALAASAFGTPAPAYYVFDNEDGRGPSPNAVGALIVSGANTNVELALDNDIVRGVLYRLRAIGVPGADGSASTAGSDQLFRVGSSPRVANAEPKVSDTDLLVYGRDLVWTGTDYQESAESDLGTVEGAANAEAAIRRRELGTPLAWAPNYSPQARQYVDMPVTMVASLRGRLQEQALVDDRVRAANVRLIVDDSAPEDSLFEISVTLVGGKTLQPIAIQVPLT